jgi:hypothetical protein
MAREQVRRWEQEEREQLTLGLCQVQRPFQGPGSAAGVAEPVERDRCQ